MTDETPQSEGEPSPAVPDETPTTETASLTADATPDPDVTQATPVAPEAPTEAAPIATAPAAEAADRPAGIFIPKWVAILAAAIVAALVFGGIGYAIGDASSDSGSTESASVSPGSTNGGQLPDFPNGNDDDDDDDGNGGGQTTSDAGFLGVAVQPADGGVEVTEIESDSPAADAGLETGDVITAIDDTEVTTPLALRSAVQEHSSGDEITVTYTRDGMVEHGRGHAGRPARSVGLIPTTIPPRSGRSAVEHLGDQGGDGRPLRSRRG